jgi:hypothetical protein
MLCNTSILFPFFHKLCTVYKPTALSRPIGGVGGFEKGEKREYYCSKRQRAGTLVLQAFLAGGL